MYCDDTEIYCSMSFKELRTELRMLLKQKKYEVMYFKIRQKFYLRDYDVNIRTALLLKHFCSLGICNLLAVGKASL
jgi:hypothetical protein